MEYVMKLKCENECEESLENQMFECDVTVSFTTVAAVNEHGDDCGIIGDPSDQAERGYKIDLDEALKNEWIHCQYCQGPAVKEN
jgi:hypothetical protein